MAFDLQQAFESSSDYPHIMGRIISRTWSDPEFKSSFIANPAQVLRDNGIPVPEGMQLTAGDAGAGNVNIPLPPRPPEISDEQLGSAVGDGDSCAGSGGSLSCPCCSAGTAGSAH